MKYLVILLALTLFASNLFFAYGSVSLDRTAYPVPDVDPLELWNINDVIIDGTVIDKESIQDENMKEIFGFNIKVNEYFKGKQNAKIIYAKQLHVFPNFDLEKDDNALFYIRNASEFGYVIQSHSVKTFGDCTARDLIEISPVLPNEGFPRSAPTRSESYFDSCIADYFTYDPDFFSGIHNGISPLKQIKHGIPNEMIRCYDGLVLIHKYDDSPVCVTEPTKQKLIERGWTAKNDSTLSKINTRCMTIEQSKHVASFFKTPTYLPEGYSHVCSRSGMPFESYIVYYNQEFPNNWQIHELVNEGAIFIYQIDERNFVGEKKYATYGSPEQRTRETYDSVIEGNPSLNPQLITINGMLAYAVDSCPDCGMQIANFTDGSSIQKSTFTETKIKFIDENGVNYMLKTTLPLDELILVAESLQ